MSLRRAVLRIRLIVHKGVVSGRTLGEPDARERVGQLAAQRLLAGRLPGAA